MNITNDKTVELLKQRTNDFKKSCFEMKQTLEKFVKDLKEIEDIEKDIIDKMGTIEQNSREYQDLYQELMNRQLETKEYLEECNKLKIEIKQKEEQFDKYSKFIKILTSYNELKNSVNLKKNPAKSIDKLHEFQTLLNNEFKNLFQTNYELEDVSVLPRKINSLENEEEYSNYLKNFYEGKTLKAKEELNKILHGTHSRYGIFQNLPFDLEVEGDELIFSELEGETSKKLPKDVPEQKKKTEEDFKIEFETLLERAHNIEPSIEEKKVVPSFLQSSIDMDNIHNKIKEEFKEELTITKPNFNEVKEEKETERKSLIEETIEKRIENYNSYLKRLYEKLDECVIESAKFNNEMKERINKFEPIDDITKEYNKEREIQNLLFKEVQRITLFTETDKKNVRKNLNIPNLDMEMNEIIDHLKENKQFDFTPLPEIEQKQYPLITGVKKEEKKELTLSEKRLQLYQTLKSLNLSKEEISKMMDAYDKKEAEENKAGKAFKWVRNAAEKTKQIFQKNKKGILVAASLSLLAIVGGKAITSTGPEKITLNETQRAIEETQNSVVLNNNLEEAITIELDSNSNINIPITIEPSKEDNFNSISFEDNLTLKSPDIPIYNSEYLENKMTPFYPSDTIRQIISFGFRMPNGTIERAFNESQRETLLNSGGKYFSIQTFDGFFDINDIVIQKEKGLGI